MEQVIERGGKVFARWRWGRCGVRMKSWGKREMVRHPIRSEEENKAVGGGLITPKQQGDQRALRDGFVTVVYELVRLIRFMRLFLNRVLI